MTVRSTAAPLMGTVRRRSALRNAWQRFRRKMVRSQLVSLNARLGANAVQQGSGPILLASSCVGVVLALASPAHSEGAAGESASNQLAPEQSLTITDLEGLTIQIKLVNEMLVQRGGPQFPVTSESDWKITVEFGSKNRLEFPADLSQPARYPGRPENCHYGYAGSILVHTERRSHLAVRGRHAPLRAFLQEWRRLPDEHCLQAEWAKSNLQRHQRVCPRAG